jgi:hypothetical protein
VVKYSTKYQSEHLFLNARAEFQSCMEPKNQISLRDTVAAISPPLIRTAEALRTDAPGAFEKWLVHGVQVVGFGFYPTGATGFVQALNNSVEKDLASA